MSWTSCMQGKIEDEWGTAAAPCASAGSADDLDGIVKCIIQVAVDVDPSPATVLALLTEWSVECAL